MDSDLRDWQRALDLLASYGLDPDEVVQKAGENITYWSEHPCRMPDDFIIPEDDI